MGMVHLDIVVSITYSLESKRTEITLNSNTSYDSLLIRFLGKE